MPRFVHAFALGGCALLAMVLSSGAGDGTASGGQRTEFHLSTEYPYVFRPVGYLQSEGPAPMRYGEPAIDCSHRSAPALPAAARGTPLKPADDAEKAAAAQPAASPAPLAHTTAAATAAYPVPDNGPAATVPKGSADFSKAPDEVVGYFRNPYNFVPNTHRFFDPIFEPGQAQGNDQGAKAQQGPKSSATYNETP